MVFKYLVSCDKTQSDSLSLESVKGGSLLLVRSGLQQKNVTKTVYELLDFKKVCISVIESGRDAD